jgi:serine/threonine-protein kinase
MDPTGRLLADRYELQVPLASGGMGRVWRARDTRLQRPVAVKLLRSEFTGDPTFRARFRAEAQHAAVLTHPNIASVYDYGEVEQDGELLAYLVMELVDGEPLSALLARERRLDVARTLGIVRQTAAALAAAHAAGVVHRDVKPGNVLVGRDEHVKITDFGIARSAASVPLTQTGQVIGTAHYLSPEQAQGGQATPASDVYALGAVAYECLAGRRPIDGENPVQIAVKQIREEPQPLPPDIPPAVRQLVERAMAKDPAWRFPDGAALRDAVDAVEAGRPTGPISGRTGTAVMPLPVMGTGTAPLPRMPPPAAGPPPPVRPAAAPAAPAARGSGGRAALRVLVGALVVLVLVGVAALLLRSAGGEAEQAAAPSTTAEAPVQTTPQQTTPEVTTEAFVAVASDDYVDRPLEEVQAELAGLGLLVTPEPVETEDTEPGLVTAVEPEGDLTPGSTVTVSYAVAPEEAEEPPPADEGDQGNGNGNGNGRGNGNGNGRGDDDD